MRTVTRDRFTSSAARRVHSVERARRGPEPSVVQAYRAAWNQGKIRYADIPAQYQPYV